jgi:MFS family permease
MNWGILLQGFGGIFAVPLIEAYGRYPVWLWPQIITMFMVLGATLSNDYSTFTVFRSLQGLFGTVPQVIGLSIIHDMYKPHEWPRMVNIWGTTFLVGPFIGPALAGYIGAGTNWRDSFGVLTAILHRIRRLVRVSARTLALVIPNCLSCLRWDTGARDWSSTCSSFRC